jgi:hypothetical protein
MDHEQLPQYQPTKYDQSPETQIDGPYTDEYGFIHPVKPYVDEYGFIHPAGKPYVDEYGTIHAPGTYQDRNGVMHPSKTAAFNPRTGAFELTATYNPLTGRFEPIHKNSPPIQPPLNTDPNAPKLRAPKRFTFEKSSEKDTASNAPKSLEKTEGAPVSNTEADPNDIWRQDSEIAQVAVPIANPVLPGYPGYPGMGGTNNGPSEKLRLNLDEKLDQINPFRDKREAEREAIGRLTPDQIAGLRKSKYREKVRYATDSFTNSNSCAVIDIDSSHESLPKAMMVDALTGDIKSTIVIDPKGNTALYDGRYRGAAKGKDKLRNTLFEIEPIVPGNGAEEDKARAFLMRKQPEWVRQGKIAHSCGMQMQVAIPDADLVQWANQHLKVSPGTQIKEAQLGGTRREVRPGTVGGQFHHMPSSYAIEDFMNYEDGWGIWMYEGHHKDTKSHGSNKIDGDVYRKKQKKLINSGRYDDALNLDAQDMQKVAPGLYDLSIKQMLKKMKKRGVK